VPHDAGHYSKSKLREFVRIMLDEAEVKKDIYKVLDTFCGKLTCIIIYLAV